jgi:hypothetical protein
MVHPRPECILVFEEGKQAQWQSTDFFKTRQAPDKAVALTVRN